MVETDDLHYLTKWAKKIHVITTNTNNTLSLNAMYLDNYFSVKGAGTEVKHRESSDAHCLVKDADADVRREENYLALWRMQSEDIMISAISLRSNWKMIIVPCR